jgi:hypothetical protein
LHSILESVLEERLHFFNCHSQCSYLQYHSPTFYSCTMMAGIPLTSPSNLLCPDITHILCLSVSVSLSLSVYVFLRQGLSMKPTLMYSSQSPYLCFPCSGITGVNHRTQPSGKIFYLPVLETEARTLHMLDKCCATEQHLQPHHNSHRVHRPCL